MERRWGRAKYYTRRHCNSTMPKLREVILDALGTQNIDHEMSFRFERKSIDYADAYFSGDASDPIVAKVFLRGKKEYRSHRGIPPSEYTGSNPYKPLRSDAYLRVKRGPPVVFG